jgi:hypothetical protein
MKSFMNDLLGAVIMATLIGFPFGLYFAFGM